MVTHAAEDPADLVRWHAMRAAERAVTAHAAELIAADRDGTVRREHVDRLAATLDTLKAASCAFVRGTPVTVLTD